jgi:hypothetical protein
MCFVRISEQTAILSLYSINGLIFITKPESVYCAVRAGSLYIKQIRFVFKGLISRVHLVSFVVMLLKYLKYSALSTCVLSVMIRSISGFSALQVLCFVHRSLLWILFYDPQNKFLITFV